MGEQGQLPFGARASMELVDVALRYRDEGGESGFLSLGPLAAPACTREDDAVLLEASFDGEVLELAALPKRMLWIDQVKICFRHAFASDEKVLLNGYQSWTDTVERPAWAAMRGLRGVPKRLVDRYALDGSGDYAMVEYSGRRGCQHGFTYATFRRGEGMVLLGSLDDARGFTLIRTDAAKGEVVLEPECPQSACMPGQRTGLGSFAVARGLPGQCYDRWFELSGICARPAKRLAGYTSWYRHYGDIDEAKLLGDLNGASRFREGLHEREGAGADLEWLFQIDDGYCKVGDWLQVDRVKFPSGMASLAERIREAGFVPGLWVAPFVCERRSRLFAERPEWLLRDASGDPVLTGSHWSGGFALDTRNVEVRSYVLEFLQAMTREWGFGLIKADFLYAACMHPHDGLNCGELMADAIDLLRTGAGQDALILGCGVPLASAFGKLDYCRIGCDVGLDWDDAPHMRLLHRERVSTKNSFANTRGRAYLDGRAFGNDPDVFFLRDDVRLSRAQRKELLAADAVLGSMLLTSDDMGAWSDWQRECHGRALAAFCSREGLPYAGRGVSDRASGLFDRP